MHGNPPLGQIISEMVYLYELPVVPVHHPSPISSSVHQILLDVRSDPDPEQGRQPPDGRCPVLVHVVQDDIIQRQDVLQLSLG